MIEETGGVAQAVLQMINTETLERWVEEIQSPEFLRAIKLELLVRKIRT